MLIDCTTCEVRDIACDDCVVTVLLGPTRLESGATFAETLSPGPSSGLSPGLSPLGVHAFEGVALDADERAALAVLADSGLVPPLRLVPPPGGRPAGAGADRTESTGHAV